MVGSLLGGGERGQRVSLSEGQSRDETLNYNPISSGVIQGE